MKKDSLLIIHQGALGDFILILPVILMLKRNYNRIDLFCPRQHGILAEYLKIVDKSFSVESSEFASLFSKNPASSIIDILNHYEELLIFSFSKSLKEKVCSIIKSKVYQIPPRPSPESRIHVMEYIRQKLKESDLIKEDNIPLYKGKDIRGKKTIIHPGAGSKRKRWDVFNFLKLYHMLKAEEIEAEFVIGPAEEDLFYFLKKYIPYNKVHFSHDILEVIRLLQSAKGFIGNDSGITHLSAFLSIPTLAIFGPSDPIRWKPIGSRVEFIRAEPDCIPCFEIRKENCDNPLCLKIDPKIVFKKYIELIF